MVNYASLSTEQRNPRSKSLDLLTASQLVHLMNREDQKTLLAVQGASAQISRAIGLIADTFRRRGRLFFVGAGTSGRLGVIEAAECPPTFNTNPRQIQAIMAGGKSAVFRSKEGAEDSELDARRAIKVVRKEDTVVGVAASGVTPFVKAALLEAHKRRANTILVTCNPHPPKVAAVTIVLKTGPEILTGSTRLKAGTACKMVLNMLTTGSLVQVGKVYGNRMVDLQPKSKKLVERGVRLIAELGKVREPEARDLLKAAGGKAKIAIVMARKHYSRVEAIQRLKKANGFLKDVLPSARSRKSDRLADGHRNHSVKGWRR